MKNSHIKIWTDISNIEFDDPLASFSFSARLARDNGWAEEYALRVIDEYKKFAFLAVTTGREVTPSDEVDQAWHLHLTYSRHYWGEFTEALGAKLHHGPTKGGASEKTRYWDNYVATLSAYEEAFGEAPPTDIWPPAEKRFGDAPFMQRVNTSENLVLPKRAIKRVQLGALVGAGATGALLAGSAAAQEAGSIVDKLTQIPVIVSGVIILITTMVLFALAGSRSGKKGNGNAGGYADGGAGAKGGGKGDGGSDGASGCGGGGCGGCGG